MELNIISYFNKNSLRHKYVIGPISSVLLIVFAEASFAAPITSESDPELIGAAKVDFDTAPQGDYPSTGSGFSSGNVNFNSNGSFKIDSFLTTGPYAITGNQLHNQNESFSTLRFTFTNPVSAFGMSLVAFDAAWELTAYNQTDQALESFLVTPTAPLYDVQYAGISVANTAYATLVFKDPSKSSVDWFGIDDFSFVTSKVSTVPEPSVLSILLIGLAGIGWSRYKT